MNALTVHRIHFAFTITFHYLFPQLTMGLALLIVVLKTLALRTSDSRYDEAARFWTRIFAINFVIGVVTGIPMEFQFGMNWAYYSHYVGDIFGVPLAVEGLMAFFLEATFVGLFFFGWDRLSRLQHLMVTWLVALGGNRALQALQAARARIPAGRAGRAITREWVDEGLEQVRERATE